MPAATSPAAQGSASNGQSALGGGNITNEPAAPDSSKFRRFFKRFGRHPSDENIGEASEGANGQNGSSGAQANGDEATGDAFATQRSRRGSKSKGDGATRTKSKRSDSLLTGRFFQSSSNAPPVPRPGSSSKQTPATPSPGGASSAVAPAFENTNVKGLANTLTLPSAPASPPPQLGGLPQHDPIATSDLTSTPSAQIARNGTTAALGGRSQRDASANDAHPSTGLPIDASSQTVANNPIASHGVQDSAQQRAIPIAGEHRDDENILSPQSSYGSSRSHASPSFDSANALRRNRDSVDNRTVDTGKSRASTKPTTLMSMDTRENAPGASYAPLAQIAQHRQGETAQQHQQHARVPSTGTRLSTHDPASGSDHAAGAITSTPSGAIHFASAPPMGRTPSGTIVQLPGQGEAPEDLPYTNVPSLSRPHPANNPHPSGIPADNASVLTLASSTAAASITGGASSRGHSHAAPSLGGARSIGGSLMGDRRNSSDTYASVKALPPLSRRGSASSSRTGMSVAASAYASAAQPSIGANPAAPGAPGDRISLHRTPSQKTIATQLSIPLSHSNHALAGAGQGEGGNIANGTNEQLHSAATGTEGAPAATSGEDGADGDVVADAAEHTAETRGATMEVPSITTTQP